MLNSGINDLWPTKIYKGLMEGEVFEKALNHILMNEDLENPKGEFQSYDILNDGPQEMQEFRDKIVYPAFEEYVQSLGLDVDLNGYEDSRLRSWITGTKYGYMIPAHNHSGAHFSAIFYLVCTEQDKGGELVLIDPRANANRGFKNEFKPLFANELFSPKSGEFLIFPSFVYHHTNVFFGNTRLAMPVDLFL